MNHFNEVSFSLWFTLLEWTFYMMKNINDISSKYHSMINLLDKNALVNLHVDLFITTLIKIEKSIDIHLITRSFF